MLKRIAFTTFALAAFTAAPGLAQTVKTVLPNQTSPTSGKEMFNEYCAVCHGRDGKGSGPAASALKKTPTDLTRLVVQNNGKFPDGRVARHIEGYERVSAHGSLDMPTWGTVFKSMNGSDEIVRMRISNLTEYIKSLQAK